MRRIAAVLLASTLFALPARHVVAAVEEGIAAYTRLEFGTALRELKPAADGGHAEAQYLIGAMYANGQGVGKDAAEAARWFRRSADQGFAPAQNALGDSYRRGEGVAKNTTEAARWLELAANQGRMYAQYSLALLYA